MADVEAHITGTVWKIEVQGRRQRRRGRHRRHPRVDEDGDAGRGRGRGHRHGDPLRGGPGRQRGRHRSSSWSELAATELAGGRLLLDEPAEHVARLTIANPAKRNALDHEILDAIADVVPTLDARCLVLTGSEGMFSAGYDIGDIPAEVFAEEAEKLVAHPFAAAIEALEAYPYPTRRRPQRPRDRRRARGRAVLRPARRRARDPARDAAGQARAHLLAHRAAQVPRRRSARRARASCSSSGATSTPRRAAELGPGQRRRRRRRSSRAARWRWPRRSPATRRSRSSATSASSASCCAAESRSTSDIERELVELRRACFAPTTSARGSAPSGRSARRAGRVAEWAPLRHKPSPYLRLTDSKQSGARMVPMDVIILLAFCIILAFVAWKAPTRSRVLALASAPASSAGRGSR